MSERGTRGNNLGAALGSVDFRENFVLGKVKIWCDKIELLNKIELLSKVALS